MVVGSVGSASVPAGTSSACAPVGSVTTSPGSSGSDAEITGEVSSGENRPSIPATPTAPATRIPAAARPMAVTGRLPTRAARPVLDATTEPPRTVPLDAAADVPVVVAAADCPSAKVAARTATPPTAATPAAAAPNPAPAPAPTSDPEPTPAPPPGCR